MAAWSKCQASTGLPSFTVICAPQVGGDAAFDAIALSAGGHRLGVRAEAAAGGAGQLVQVLGGFGEFQRPGLGRAGRVRRGVHQDPPQAVHRVALAGAGQVHPLVLQHPVAAPRGGGLARVPPGGIVHRDARAVRQRREQPGRDPGGGQRRDEPDRPAAIAATLAQEISLESPISRNSRGPAIVFSAVIAPMTWDTSAAPPS